VATIQEKYTYHENVSGQLYKRRFVCEQRWDGLPPISKQKIPPASWKIDIDENNNDYTSIGSKR
jgi:hypothetical protein